MTSGLSSTTRRSHAPFARALVFVLLTLITYTATIDSIHTHGGDAPPASRHRITAAAESTHKSESGSSSLKKQFNGDCLICQFHQHLSNGLRTELPRTLLPQAQRVALFTAAAFGFSQTRTSRRGRAPPLTFQV